MASQFQDFFWPPRTREATLYPPLFTGEMVFSWMFADYAELRPLAQIAGILAKEKDWPALYDLEQLAKNEVPVAAATYVEDMYVDYEMSKETKDKIRGCQQWITNKYSTLVMGMTIDICIMDYDRIQWKFWELCLILLLMGHPIEHSRTWVGLGRYRIMCIAYSFIFYAVYHLVMQSMFLSKGARLYLSDGSLDWQIQGAHGDGSIQHFYYRTRFYVALEPCGHVFFSP